MKKDFDEYFDEIIGTLQLTRVEKKKYKTSLKATLKRWEIKGLIERGELPERSSRRIQEWMMDMDKGMVIQMVGSLEKRIPGNINFTFPFLNGISIIPLIPNLAVSNGSACSSSDPSPSHVLSQIGVSKKNANSSLRIGIGRFTNEQDIDIAIKSIKNALGKK